MAKPPNKLLCPCHSGVAYTQCCAPAHEGTALPESPLALMRSRYSAYAKGNATYLHATVTATHADAAIPLAEFRKQIARDAPKQRFTALDVLRSETDNASGSGWVLFFAKLYYAGREVSFTELSDFARVEGQWRYAAGILVNGRAVAPGFETLAPAALRAWYQERAAAESKSA